MIQRSKRKDLSLVIVRRCGKKKEESWEEDGLYIDMKATGHSDKMREFIITSVRDITLTDW